MKKHKSIGVDSAEYAETFDDLQLGNSHPFFNGSMSRFKQTSYHAKNPAYLELINHVFKTSVSIIRKGMKNKKGKYIIFDGGAGTCNFSLTLAAEFPKALIIACDIQKKMLLKGEKKAKQKGIKNIQFINQDIENVKKIAKQYGLIDYAFSIQCLFNTGSKTATKPNNILKNIYQSLNKNSSFLLIDFNKKHNVFSWVIYVTWNSFLYYIFEKRGFFKFILAPFRTINTFIKHKNSRLVQTEIKIGQKKGEFLVCTKDELQQMMEHAGFHVLDKPQTLYRGYDNRILGFKK